MRARYYSPTLRRFVNADKVHGDITNALTLNRYAFCNGDPANGVDPLGLCREENNGKYTNKDTSTLSNTENKKDGFELSDDDSLLDQIYEYISGVPPMVVARCYSVAGAAIFGFNYSHSVVSDGKERIHENSITFTQGACFGAGVSTYSIIYFGYSSIDEYQKAGERIFSKTLNLAVVDITIMYEYKNSEEIPVGIVIPTGGMANTAFSAVDDVLDTAMLGPEISLGGIYGAYVNSTNLID